MAQQVHLRLPDDVVLGIESVIDGSSLPQKAMNILCSFAVQREMLLIEKERAKNKLKIIELQLKKNPLETLTALEDTEIEFLIETSELIESRRAEWIGRCKRFNLGFSRCINIKDFKLLVHKVIKEKEQKNK